MVLFSYSRDCGCSEDPSLIYLPETNSVHACETMCAASGPSHGTGRDVVTSGSATRNSD